MYLQQLFAIHGKRQLCAHATGLDVVGFIDQKNAPPRA